MAKQWSDDELLAAIEQEESTAINWADGPLADARAEALRRFNREPYGTEVEGRSQVVDNTIADSVEGVMPALARIFLSGDEIGRFEPLSPEDRGYEVESECVNWYLTTRNPGFEVLYATFKDALLLGNGYCKAWWQTRDDVVAERYQGMSDEEAAMLMQDRDVQVVEHSEYPDPMGNLLHNLKVERTRPEEYVAICAVPPDEVLVSARHRETSLADCDFVQHRRTLSIGELRQLGYEVDDDIGDNEDDSSRPEYIARQRYDEDSVRDEDDSSDATRRLVTLRETWMRLGMGGKKQTLWRICVVGTTILHKEEADSIPIAAFSPIFYPHSHVGISYASLLDDLAELNTTIFRQYLDNLYLANSTQIALDVNVANVDDFLVSRPGGIKRIEGNPANAVMPLVTPDMGGSALNALEFINQLKENRTGVARVNQGNLDPNSLNRTATGASLMMNAGQQRLELIARCLAGGVKDLFLLVHALAQKHSTKPLQIRLHNNWITTDPRTWAKRTDFSLTVALGTGNPEAQMAKLTAIGQFMQQGMGLGLVGPMEMYRWGKEYLRTAGYRNSEQFLKEPPKDPQTGQPLPPPQQPNPLVQVETIKQQSAHALKDKELAADGQRLQVETQQKYALEQQRMQNEIAAQNAQAEADMALERYKVEMQATLEREKAQIAADTAIRTKLIEVAGTALMGSGDVENEAEDAAEGPEEPDPMREALPQMLQALQATMAQLSAAKRVVRDQAGRVVGVESVPPLMQ